MGEKLKYYAFISYSHKDSEWAKWLQHELEYYQLPATLNGREGLPKSFRPVFRDEDELSGGELKSQISRALADSEFLIVICSPNSAKSGYVNNEIKEFIEIGKTRNEDYTKRIFPLIVEGKPHQGKNSPSECFPPSLNSLHDINGKHVELIAGDVNATGSNHAFIKILAGTLNEKSVQFSELWDRYELAKHEEEQKRKENLRRYFKMSSRFVAEKLKSEISEGNIALAAKAINYLIKNNESNIYIDEVDYTLRSILGAHYFNFTIPENNNILNNLLRGGDISPDGKKLVSVTANNNEICLWDFNNSYLLETINLVEIQSADYICFVNDKMLAIVENPSFLVKDTDDSSQSLIKLKIDIIEIESKKIISRFEFECKDVRWIRHVIVDGVLLIGIGDGSDLYLINPLNGSLRSLPINTNNKNRICLAESESILYLKPDYIQKSTTLVKISLNNASHIEIARFDKILPHSYVGISSHADGRIFIFDGTKVYEYHPQAGQLSLVYESNQIVLDIDYDYNHKILAVLSEKTIKFFSELNSKEWKNIFNFNHSRSYGMEHCVRLLSNEIGAVVWGDLELRILMIKYNGIDTGTNLNIGKTDQISFFRIIGDKIIIATKEGLLIIRDYNSLKEIHRFDTALTAIFDATIIDDKIYLISSTSASNDVKYLLRKAYENDSSDILSIWTVNGDLIDVIETDDVDFEGSLFCPNVSALVITTLEDTLQYWGIDGTDVHLLWEKPDLMGSVIKIANEGNYILFRLYDDCTLAVLDISSGETVAMINCDNIGEEDDISIIECVDFCTVLNLIAIGYSNGTIIVYSLEANAILNKFNTNMIIKNILFSPDGQYLYIASYDSICMLSTNSGLTIEKHECNLQAEVTLAHTNDPERILYNSKDSIYEIRFDSYETALEKFSEKYSSGQLVDSEKRMLYLD